MIIQTAPQGEPRFAMRMDEHTALAADFAEAFGNAEFEAVEPRELVLYMVRHHDRGWADFDAAPGADPRTGLPYNLVDTPAAQITRTSAGSPDFNERHHPYCGLLSSMHSWGLYNGRYGLSDHVLIDTIGPEERHLAEAMLAAELARQDRLKRALAADPACARWLEPGHLMQNYKQLQFFDTLALYFNRTHEGARSEATFRHVPRDARRDADLVVRPAGQGAFRLHPWPFSADRLDIAFSGRYLTPNHSPVRWDAVLAAAPVRTQQARLMPA